MDYLILAIIVLAALLFVLINQRADNMRLKVAIENRCIELAKDIAALNEEILEVKSIIDARKHPRSRT